MALCFLAAASGLSLPTKAVQPLPVMPTRREVLAGSSAILGWAAFGDAAHAEDLGSGLTYSVVKSSKSGGQPVVGDLIVIRFKSVVKETGQVSAGSHTTTLFLHLILPRKFGLPGSAFLSLFCLSQLLVRCAGDR